jgi:hypothetical protein
MFKFKSINHTLQMMVPATRGVALAAGFRDRDIAAYTVFRGLTGCYF